jgi:hypothetical protein
MIRLSHAEISIKKEEEEEERNVLFVSIENSVPRKLVIIINS